jgi:hypothetical protein
MDYNPMGNPPSVGVKLSKYMCSKTTKEEKGMEMKSFTMEVGSLMYTMICTTQEFIKSMGVVCRFMENPER